MTPATAPSNAPSLPRASATLVLLRDSPAGPEVLMVRRADRGDQNSNAWVFPGGLLEPGDSAARLLARAPEDQQVEVDGEEIVEHRWARPADVLTAAHAHRLGGPARATLKALSVHADVEGALAHARAQGPLRTIQPRFSLDATGARVPVLPQHPAWAEIGLLDPAGQGTVHHVLRPGAAVALGEGIVRVTAPNDGVTRGSGPNTYLVRCGDDDAGDWVLIDPGPDDEAHVQAVLAALPGRLLGMLVTQAPPDPSPAAVRLRSLTGASLYGPPPAHAQHHDAAWVPDEVLRGCERLAFGPRLTLQVVHTTGDASNSLSYLHTQARLLFTGDLVMPGATAQADSVLDDGLDALCGPHRLRVFDWIAPGRGFLSPAPRHAHDELPTPPQPTLPT